MVLVAIFISGVATGGQSFLTCEYVGDRENIPGIGAGALDRPRPTRSRFAGSGRRVAQGSPAGTGGQDFAGISTPRTGFQTSPTCTCSDSGRADPFSQGARLEERFSSEGTLRVLGSGRSSRNGHPIFQNIPTCVDPTGAGLDQLGLPALYRWTIGIGNLVSSDLHLEVCLDVRKCQEDDDVLGAGMTVPIQDYIDEFGPEGPLTVRVVQHRGDLWTGIPPGPSRCPCEDRTLGLIAQPFDGRLTTGPPPWQPLPDATGELEIDHSTQFLGHGCNALIVHNDGNLAIHDFLTVEVRIPASTRVRIRASSDSVAACYLGGVPSDLVD